MAAAVRLLLILCFLGGCTTLAPPYAQGTEAALPQPGPSAAVPELTAELKEASFEAVAATIRDRFYDRSFGGRNWEAIAGEHRAAVMAASDHVAFHRALNTMVQSLGGSHISVAPPRLPGLAGSSLTAIGVELVAGGERALVQAVEPGGPAAESGILIGDEILEIDGVPVADLAHGEDAVGGVAGARLWLAAHGRLRGRPGSKVNLLVRSGDQVRRVELRRAASVAHGRVAPPSFRMLDDGIGLLSIPTFMIDPEPALAVFREKCARCTKILIDLRGNGGGQLDFLQRVMSSLVADAVPLGLMETSEGTTIVTAEGTREAAFAGQVAILIDGRSASSSEVLAAAIQDSGRGTVVGSPSAGAVLLSYIEMLPTGGSLLFPAAQFRRSSGAPLEGVGVTPNVAIVPSADDLRNGRDAVKKAALSAS